MEWADSQDELDEKERYWIQKLNSTDVLIGYNVQDGGYHTDANYISLGLKHYYNNLTEEQKLQQSLRFSGESNGMYGRHHTEKTKQLWKEHHRGEHKHSEETKQKRSKALKGRQFSEETRKLMS